MSTNTETADTATKALTQRERIAVSTWASKAAENVALAAEADFPDSPAAQALALKSVAIVLKG